MRTDNITAEFVSKSKEIYPINYKKKKKKYLIIFKNVKVIAVRHHRNIVFRIYTFQTRLTEQIILEIVS